MTSTPVKPADERADEPLTPATQTPAAEAPFRMAKLGGHSAIYAIGILFSRGVSLIMMPLYTRVLSPADYGILQLIGMTIDVAGIVAGSRIASGVFHYYHKASTAREKHNVISTALHVLMMTYGAAALIMLSAAPVLSKLVFGTPDYAVLLRIATFSLALECLIQVPIAYLQLEGRSTAFVTMNAAKLSLQVVFNVIFLVPLKMGPAGVLWSTLIANSVIGTIYSLRLIRQVGFRFSRSAARDIVEFGVPFVFTQIATFFATFGDRYFLNHAADAAAVGLYGLAYQFGFLLVNLGYAPFIRIWEPMRFEVAKRADHAAIFQRTFVYMNLAMLSAAVVLALYVQDFLRIIASREFFGAAPLVPVILLAYVLQCWTYFHNFGMYITERPGMFTLANWIGALVALVGYVLLIPPYKAWGAAWATLASFAARELVTYVVAQRLWPIAFDWRPVLRLLGIAMAVTAVALMLPALSLVWSIGARTLLLAGYAYGAWHLGVLSAADKALVRRFIVAPRATLASLRRA